MRYNAKIDWFVTVSLLVGVVAPAFIAFTENSPWLTIISFVAVALVFGILYPQWYETRPNALIIKSGLTTRVITYERMRGVRPTNDGRLSINYGIGDVLVTPREPEKLLDDLARRTASHLVRSGKELVPASNQ